MSKHYRVSVAWTMVGSVEIVANDEDAACSIAMKMPLSAFDAEYCDDSFQVDDVEQDDEDEEDEEDEEDDDE